MKINKRAVLVEGIFIFIIISGLLGIHFKLDSDKVISFIGGNLFGIVLIISIGVIIYVGILLFKWINEDVES